MLCWVNQVIHKIYIHTHELYTKILSSFFFEFPDKPKGIFKKNKNCTINNRGINFTKKQTSAGLNRENKHSRSPETTE
jgi:hypothetical protein